MLHWVGEGWVGGEEVGFSTMANIAVGVLELGLIERVVMVVIRAHAWAASVQGRVFSGVG